MFDPTKYGDNSASFYDQLYAGVEAGIINTLKSLAGNGPALDFGIGTGRVAIPLLQSGITVYGIEASTAMISMLRKHKEAENIPVIEGDFVGTPLGNKYQLIYSLVSTFLLLPSLELQQDCFFNIARHLRPGGFFISEVYESKNSFPETDTNTIPIITESGTKEYRVTCLATPIDILDQMAARAGLVVARRWSDWRQKQYMEGNPRHITVYALRRDS